jgi:V/A-type H+/Na+-transporting ATPase subunit C
MPGFRDAINYGYSNTRVKAMESKLVAKDTIERMLAAKEIESIGAMLLQTSYKGYIEEFGGTKSMDKLIDFALSKSLGRETNKLVDVAPAARKDLVRNIVGIWDMSNAKFMFGAMITGKGFDDISRYLIDAKYVTAARVKDAMATNSVESAIAKLSAATPYKQELKAALNAYRKSKSVMEVDSAIDMAYYAKLGSTIERLMKINRESAQLIARRIDLKNALTLLNAKRHGAEFAAVKGYLVRNGSVGTGALGKAFESSKSVDALALAIGAFDLRQAAAEYSAGKGKSLMVFEIAMMNELFRGALKTVRHSVLSFGTIIAFLYLKEMEVSTLRIIVKGRSYGLAEDEIRKMVTWSR